MSGLRPHIWPHRRDRGQLFVADGSRRYDIDADLFARLERTAWATAEAATPR
jgi:hypothetical protein